MGSNRRNGGTVCPTRRTVLQGSAAMTAATVIGGRMARAASITLGEASITVVSDGHLTLPAGFVFPEQTADELDALLTPRGMATETLKPACNLTLLRSGERLVLFDAGSGPLFQDTAGKIGDSLAEAGVDPSEITDVVFTHAHPDHIWGVLDDFDEVVFSEAAHWIATAEWDFWRAEETMAAMPEERKSFVVGARNRFAAIEDSVSFFGPGDEILPGVEVVDTSGHTAGHASFMLHGGGERAFVTGDALTHPVVSFEKPDWRIGTDHDREKGAATRAALLDRLAADQPTVIGFHLTAPGIGRVERAGTAYRFVPDS